MYSGFRLTDFVPNARVIDFSFPQLSQTLARECSVPDYCTERGRKICTFRSRNEIVQIFMPHLVDLITVNVRNAAETKHEFIRTY